MNAEKDILELSPDELYWSILDTSVLPQGRQRRQQYDYLFERVLPVPVDEVQISYTAVSESRVLACGMCVEQLRARLSEADVAPVAAVPARLPDIEAFYDVDVGRRVQLNLLHGPFLPAAVRRAKGTLSFTTAIVLVVIASLLIAGLERRIAALETARREVDEHRQALYRAEFPSGTSVRPELLLSSELRQLERMTSASPGDRVAPRDVTHAIARLFAQWPTAVHAKTEQLRISGDGVDMTVVVPASDDVQKLQTAFRALGEWEVASPSTRQIRDETRARIRLMPRFMGARD